jgi:uncharacterized phage protein (TIGR02218 family)
MKTPTNIGGNNLAAFLLSATEMIVANLFTVTLKTGTILRYTDWDLPVTIGGTTWLTGPPNLSIGQIDETVGLQVATSNFSVSASPTDLISSTPILQTIARGDWDGAKILIQRLFMNESQVQIGYITRWFGELGKVAKVTRLGGTFTAKSMVARLATKMPLKVIQPACIHSLYDAGCGLNKVSFQASSSAQAGSTINTLKATLAAASGYYELGVVTFTSGLNNGFSYTVKGYVNGTPSIVTFQAPLRYAPAAGNTFLIVPGCDKLQTTCDVKFGNLGNFLGFPFVPSPETAI